MPQKPEYKEEEIILNNETMIRNFDDIMQRIKSAIQKVYSKDKYLIVNNLHERTIAHKFAEYLQSEFTNCNDWNVDCEYNKRGRNTKRLTYVDNESKKIFPDIIVHKRGTENELGYNPNFLVFEIKKEKTIVKGRKIETS